MMIISILLKSYALVLCSTNGLFASVCWMASVAFDFFWLRDRAKYLKKAQRRPTDLALLNAASLITGFAVRAAFFEATLRWKSGLPFAARLMEWLFALIKYPTGAFQGRLYASNMTGPTSYPVNLDTLGLLLPLLVFTVGCIYLSFCSTRWRPVVRGVLYMLAVLVPAVLLRWLFSTALFVGLCDFINYESQDLPIAPFLKPAFIAFLYLPFLAVAAVILQRLLRKCTEDDPSESEPLRKKHLWLWLPLILLLLMVFWEPKGSPKNGKLLINTYHTDWSRTDRPYDREWYGAASGYNYACLKRLYEGFFDVEELTGRITTADLDTASVLVIYDPNRAFTQEEIQAVHRFVDRGGGLFVIGDHTNVFGSSSHLNQILDGMGFVFRDDVLFDLDEDFFQLKDISPLHPGMLHGMTFFKFRGPASIRPTSLFTRNIFTLGNAKSMRAIYSVSNFYPPPHDHPRMWTGDFAVSVASHYGRGRVVGFADSTVFSNFEIYCPGKYEFLLNTAHWLNHSDSPLILLFKRVGLFGAVLLVSILVFHARRPRHVLVTIMVLGLMAIASWTTARLVEQARAGFPEPTRPMRFLFFAADPEDEALTLRFFVTRTPYEQKYDVFIQWVLRTDTFSGFHLHGKGFDNTLAEMLRDHQNVDAGLALIAARPEHLLLLDDLIPGTVTEARRLLLMFSETFAWEDVKARLTGILSEPGLAEAEAAWPDGMAQITEGDRRIIVVFRAERYSDRHMGFSEKVNPTEIQEKLYSEQFGMLDWLFDMPMIENSKVLSEMEN